MFSDESRYLLYRADGSERVYRRNGERYRDAWLNLIGLEVVR